VAVMQPYFYPYMGYFQLIASVDLFVIFDCVQFPRRGRVHRAHVSASMSAPMSAPVPMPAPVPSRAMTDWLTLPLARQPRETRICDLALAEDRDARWAAARARLPWLTGAAHRTVSHALAAPLPAMALPLLETHLALVMARLEIPVPLVRSSAYDIAPELRGQDRVIAVARAAGGTQYVNLPGGRTLYTPADFAAQGLGLSFIAPYTGPHLSMLQAMCFADTDVMKADLAGGILPGQTEGAP
jgi:hypothetical protein